MPEWVLTLPAIIVVFIVTQIFFLGTIILSFVKWNMVRPDLGRSFVGFANFIKVFTNSETYLIVFNTLLLSFASLLISFVLGFIIALLLNREFKGVQIFRGLMLIPFFITDVVAGIIFKTLILHPSFGIAGYLASLINMAPIDFIGNYASLTVIFLIVWQWTPFFVLILLAGLQGLNAELLQSAQIDGANFFETIYHIVIPSLMHHIQVAVMLGTVFILKVFGLIYVTTSGGPGVTTTTLPYIVFKTNQFKWEIGEAASFAVITVVLTILILTILFNFFQKKLR